MLHDIDGDGIPEFAAGASDAAVRGMPGVGLVRVLSGRDASPIRVLEGQKARGYFGMQLAEIGDADGDGMRDLCVLTPSGDDGDGDAQVFSARTGALLFSLRDTGVKEFVPWSAASCGDVDGDGVEDLAVGGGTSAGPAQDAFGKVVLVSMGTRHVRWIVRAARPAN